MLKESAGRCGIMKKLGKLVYIIIILPVVAIVAFMISIPIVNDASASKITEELQEIPLPEKTEYIEAVSKAGKMTGNGNGMQYFGAILVKSELPVEELDGYYSAYREREWDCVVEEQAGQEIACIEHGTLSFETDLSEGEQYYIIYSWGSGNELFAELDIRGH